MHIHQFRCTEIRVYANTHREISVSACEQAPRNARSFRALSRSSSPAAASASRCHARHRGHTWPVSRANSSFLRVRSRKRHEKRAVGHSLRHTVLPLASVVLPASLNVLLEALREQKQLRGNCFASQIGLKAAGDTKNAHRAHSPPQPIALASLARPTTLNMQLGALRDQQQLRENCFLKNVRAQEALESCRPTKTAQTAKGERPKSSPRV